MKCRWRQWELFQIAREIVALTVPADEKPHKAALSENAAGTGDRLYRSAVEFPLFASTSREKYYVLSAHFRFPATSLHFLTLESLEFPISGSKDHVCSIVNLSNWPVMLRRDYPNGKWSSHKCKNVIINAQHFITVNSWIQKQLRCDDINKWLVIRVVERNRVCNSEFAWISQQSSEHCKMRYWSWMYKNWPFASRVHQQLTINVVTAKDKGCDNYLHS